MKRFIPRTHTHTTNTVEREPLSKFPRECSMCCSRCNDALNGVCVCSCVPARGFIYSDNFCSFLCRSTPHHYSLDLRSVCVLRAYDRVNIVAFDKPFHSSAFPRKGRYNFLATRLTAYVSILQSLVMPLNIYICILHNSRTRIRLSAYNCPIR